MQSAQQMERTYVAGQVVPALRLTGEGTRDPIGFGLTYFSRELDWTTLLECRECSCSSAPTQGCGTFPLEGRRQQAPCSSITQAALPGRPIRLKRPGCRCRRGHLQVIQPFTCKNASLSLSLEILLQSAFQWYHCAAPEESHWAALHTTRTGLSPVQVHTADR